MIARCGEENALFGSIVLVDNRKKAPIRQFYADRPAVHTPMIGQHAELGNRVARRLTSSMSSRVYGRAYVRETDVE